MVQVTNKARGPRGFNVNLASDDRRTVLLMPGETQDLDLSDPHSKIYAAWAESGDVVFGPLPVKPKAVLPEGAGSGPSAYVASEPTQPVVQAPTTPPHGPAAPAPAASGLKLK